MNKTYGFLIKKNFKILNFKNTNDPNEIKIEAGHDAYLKNFGCLHNRKISIDKYFHPRDPKENIYTC